MRKFIISDIHGNGNVYNAIINYLEKVNDEEEVILYINGDLIDYGIESAEVLLDVLSRIKKGPFKIVYLAGNHELMMYSAYTYKNNERHYNYWMDNGGWRTKFGLENYVKEEDEQKIVDFLSNLDIYHKFEETIGGKPIVLVHASCPREVKDVCDLKVKDDSTNENIYYYLAARDHDPFFPFRYVYGHDDYFVIIGHTRNKSEYGFAYKEDDNTLNIDGGSAHYVHGYFDCDHIPLVEVKDGYLRILTFNNNNEITYGNYFEDGETIPFTEEELEKERSYLKKDLIIKKLVKNQDGYIVYESDIKE